MLIAELHTLNVQTCTGHVKFTFLNLVCIPPAFIQFKVKPFLKPRCCKYKVLIHQMALIIQGCYPGCKRKSVPESQPYGL